MQKFLCVINGDLISDEFLRFFQFFSSIAIGVQYVNYSSGIHGDICCGMWSRFHYKICDVSWVVKIIIVEPKKKVKLFT